MDATNPLTTSIPHRIDKVKLFHDILKEEVIHVKSLKELTFTGIPESDKQLRAIVWKILLNYLPPEKATWEKALKRKREEYSRFCKDLIIDPKTLGISPNTTSTNPLAAAASGNDESHNKDSILPKLERLAVSPDDHPLSTASNSRWQAYFADTEMREQIERDIHRTHPDLNFFGDEKHKECMQRALFIFAKLNPGLKYVQGMNELLAPLYHACAIDPAKDDAAYAEADSFYCFMDIMGEFRDHFCQQLDNSSVGIKATMSHLSASLRAFDSTLYQHMEVTNSINPQFYAFRWVTTLLTQEFPFPDMIQIWDALLSDPDGRLNFLLRFCVAMLLNVREELLQGDFSQNMKLLQQYPSVDVQDILRMADSLRKYKTVLVLD